MAPPAPRLAGLPRDRPDADRGIQPARGDGRTPGRWPEVERFDNSAYISATRTDVVEHALDPCVLLGGAPALQRTEYDAIVSLSRVGTAATHVPDEDHAKFWLLAEASPNTYAHLEFVLKEADSAVEQFRAEGKRVLLHCVRMESRTPTVAPLYGARVFNIPALEALSKVRRALPNAAPNSSFEKVLVHD